MKSFVSGVERNGYKAEVGFPDRIGPKDILLTWNRIQAGDVWASRFEERGQAVLVAENAAWGNDFAGRRWYSLARGRHNTDGRFHCYGPERWDSLHVELSPFRTQGETVILAQRSIGSPPTKMPRGWEQQAKQRYGGRIRVHPGKRELIPLETDLRNCGHVVTWGSGAAVKALMWGIPVTSEMPNWIAEQDNTEYGRLEMFRRLAWAQWELREIENGEAFACVLPA
jgi:hypothetical protein